MNFEVLARSGFSLERLAGFCAVADAGSIVGAARADMTRQSLLSRQIRELEEFFGTELTRRHGRGLILTDSGRELAALGRGQLTALGDFAATCRAACVRVSIAAPESITQWLILPRLAQLRAVCPKVVFATCHEENTAIAPRVQEGVYDFGFIRRKPARGETGLAELGRLDCLLAAPKSLVRGREWTLLEALTKLPLAVPAGGAMRAALERYVSRSSGKDSAGMEVAVDTTSYLHAAAALRSGVCAAVLPSIALAEFPADRTVTWPLTALKLERDPVSLMWNQRNASTRPAVATLAEAMPGILSFC